MRLWANKQRIITTTKRTLLSFQEIAGFFEKNIGPKNTAEFIVDLTDRVIGRMSDTIKNLEERQFRKDKMLKELPLADYSFCFSLYIKY